MSTTIHRILIHAYEMKRHAIAQIRLLWEEAQASRTKDVSQNFTMKTSRINTFRDLDYVYHQIST